MLYLIAKLVQVKHKTKNAWIIVLMKHYLLYLKVRFFLLSLHQINHIFTIMAHYSYIPQGVCSQCIDFEIVDGKLHNIVFTKGCPGNLKAIPKLVEGADAKWVADTLRGNTCGNKPTSCADQLARAIEQAL